MTLPSTRVGDALTSSSGTVCASSEKSSRSPTMSHSTQDIEAIPRNPDAHVAQSTVAPQFPEGGIQAWLTVIGGCVYDPSRARTDLLQRIKSRSMVTFCTFGVVQSFGVYQDYYTVRPIATDEASVFIQIAACFSHRKNTVCDQFHRVDASLLRFRNRTTCWTPVRRRIFPPLSYRWIFRISFLVRGLFTNMSATS